MSTVTPEVNNAAILEAMKQDPAFKDLVLKFERQAQDALRNKTFAIQALGGQEFTLSEVAELWQAHKSTGLWFFTTDDRTEAESKALQAKSLSARIATEALAIIKGAGYKANAEGIKSLILFGVTE